MKVFISYSWDSEQHKEWVQTLADAVQAGGDYEVIYDRVGMDHQVDRNHFMEQGIFGSDVVLAVITKQYTDKANQRRGGVGRETSMAAERHWIELDKQARTSVLALKREADAQPPNYLQASLYFDFTDDKRFQSTLAELLGELNNIRKKDQVKLRAHGAGAQADASDAEVPYSFTRTEQLVASFYRVRKPLLQGNESRDSKRKVRYELWSVNTPQPQLVLVLAPNISIRQTLEHFSTELEKLPSEVRALRALTILRPTPAQPGYTQQQLAQLGRMFDLTELTYKDYLSTYCVTSSGLQFSAPYKDPFYIDQQIYLGQGNSATPLGPAKKYLVEELEKGNASPLSLLVASGGTGKTTLFRWTTSEIESRGKSKVLLLEIDMLKKLSREEIRRARVSSLYDLYQLYAIALSKEGGLVTTRALTERTLFDLLLISGSVVIFVDGIDELFGLLHENFHLPEFIKSIHELHAELGEARVMLAGRDEAGSATVHAFQAVGVPIYSLKGFTEAEVTSYTKKRFGRRASYEMERLTQRVMDDVRAVAEGRGGVSVVLPFFVDVLCELEEDAAAEVIDKRQTAVAERLESADYPHNNTLIDLLVFSILDRERERQDWSSTVGGLVEVFKELSSYYSGLSTAENFDTTVETFLGSDGLSAVERFRKNPLLRITEDGVTYKYDFLQGYFLALWLIESFEKGSAGDLVAKHLARFSQGQGSVFDDIVRYYSSSKPDEVQRAATNMYQVLKSRLPTAIGTPQEPVERDKAAASAVCHVYAAISSKRQSRIEFSENLFRIVGLEPGTGRRRISNLHIHGDYPVIYFTDLDVWYSGFIGYETFSKCRFHGAKFYYTNFSGIEGLNRSPSFNKYVFDARSCSLGELSYLVRENHEHDSPVVAMEEFKKFFRYFFIGGHFVARQRHEFYPFAAVALDEEIVQKFVDCGLLVTKALHGHTHYEIEHTKWQRQVQKFVNENNLSKDLRAVLKPWTVSQH